ncbi:MULTISPECIES: cyclic nucleotide-binding domain-containing protein [unclassified Oceanispirochaeta]|uniref:cyclic nucleotide-binding domain-containing protein n=1 Tax=unclassified Oceanispirochaeta TaxID=2635722 RepID=UPI000E0901A3|nr:cyclic nucleotide-binding domain-containing protein [Oceanispirochaeta sp. M1]MBF9015412.1 cyclic nucleotide-binding domain-containing protein [Oceanispirochaeta sp. M2]NPD71871.1 cyclic nucleotide-binding domain-containing protein [Oceanispirochaeta sp. M1]RDG32680.1 hypothetical protein DV872_07150 [Oceanispirochaeta sp. M1]
METSEFDVYHKIALSHPLFRRLSKHEKEGLLEFYFIQEYLKGDSVLFKGDTLDSLYLVLEGRIIFNSEGSQRRNSYFSGDFWGLESLTVPRKLDTPYTAAEDTVVLRLRGEGFRRFIQNYPSVKAALKPRMDKAGYHISGFPEDAWKAVKKPAGQKKGMLHFEGRTSRKSFSLFMLVPVSLILLGLILSVISSWFLVLSAVGMILAGFEVFLRNMTLYRVSDKTASKRFFNWRNFRRDQEELPLDQIKSIQVNVNGILRHLLKIGDLTIQTAGAGIVFRHIDKPKDLQKKMMELKNLQNTVSQGEEREKFRELVRDQLSGSEAAASVASRRYRGVHSQIAAEKRPDSRIFRKSAAVLFFQLFVPVSVLLLSIVASIILSGDTGRIFPLILWTLRLSAAFRILWFSLDWWNDIYKIDLPYVWDIERKPFAREEQRTQTDLSGILNVRVSQKGIVKILLNYGDVLIETPGNSGTLQFFSVARPMKVQAEIFRFRDQLMQEKEEKRKQDSLKQFGEFAEIIKQVQGTSPVKTMRI